MDCGWERKLERETVCVRERDSARARLEGRKKRMKFCGVSKFVWGFNMREEKGFWVKWELTESQQIQSTNQLGFMWGEKSQLTCDFPPLGPAHVAIQLGISSQISKLNLIRKYCEWKNILPFNAQAQTIYYSYSCAPNYLPSY